MTWPSQCGTQYSQHRSKAGISKPFLYKGALRPAPELRLEKPSTQLPPAKCPNMAFSINLRRPYYLESILGILIFGSSHIKSHCVQKLEASYQPRGYQPRGCTMSGWEGNSRSGPCTTLERSLVFKQGVSLNKPACFLHHIVHWVVFAGCCDK